MSKIKNDPNKYVRRSDFSSPKLRGQKAKECQSSRKREREFLTAPIDSAFYIQFTPKSRQR